jgi:hypothetical protein
VGGRLLAFKPAVLNPTITERACNARRVAALGAGEIVLPVAGANGDKLIAADEFSVEVRICRVEKGVGVR